MTHHPSHAPHRVSPKPRDKGAAHTKVQHDRRHQSVEGKYGVLGAGCTVTNITYQTTQVGGNPVNYYPGIVTDGTGLKAYNSGGVITLQIDAATGSLTVNGTGVITGGTIQTSASNPRVVLDGSGLRAFDSGGTQTFNLSGANGSLTVGSSATITGGTIQTSAGTTSRVIMDASGLRAYDATGTNTINVDTTGALTVAKGSITLSSIIPAGTNARIVLDSTGIKGYNASNVNVFTVDGTTGLIQATGVLTAQTGSNIPTATITGLLPGSNRYTNSNFRNGAGTFDATNWQVVGASLSDGGTTVPVVYGVGTCKVTTTAAGACYLAPSNLTDAYRRVVPGLSYTFSHYTYPNSFARNVFIDIYWYDSTGTQIGSPDVDSTGASTVMNTWKRYSRTSQAPAGAAFGLGRHYVTNASAGSGEIYYVSCMQMEEGDRVSAYAPRADEVLVNQINANNINVANLSAISANLGTITAGTVTGATLQTAASGARVWMDSTGLYATDGTTTTVSIPASGSPSFTGHVHAQGLDLDAGTTGTPPSQDKVRWLRTSDGAVVADLAAFSVTGGEVTTARTEALSSTNLSEFILSARDDLGNDRADLDIQQAARGTDTSNTYVRASVSPGGTMTLLNAAGQSSFLSVGVNSLTHSLAGTGTMTWPGASLASTGLTVNLPGATLLVWGVATCDWTSTGQPVTVRAASGATGVTFFGFPYNGVAPAAGTTAQINYIVWGN